MKKKYVIASPGDNDDDYRTNIIFYDLQTESFSDDSCVPDSVSLKKAIKICKKTLKSTWIIEHQFPKLKNIIESTGSFENFIENCKKCELEVIETRPSIYAPSETAAAVPQEKEEEFGYVIQSELGYFVRIMSTIEEGIYATSNLPKSATIFRTVKEAEFQAKVLKLKCNEDFLVEKIDLNTFFK